MNKYFIYCRKSTEDDDHQAISLQPQVRELTRFAEAHRLPVFGDPHGKQKCSAPRSGRVWCPTETVSPAAKPTASSRGIQDRLARNAVDGGQIIHLLDAGKILGWLIDGWVIDRSGDRVFFTEDASGGPARPVRHAMFGLFEGSVEYAPSAE